MTVDLSDFVRIRLKELEEAISFFPNPPKEIQNPSTYLEGRGDALLESISLHQQRLRERGIKKIESELKNEIESFFKRHEDFLRNVPLREIGGAPTIYRGLKDFLNWDEINLGRDKFIWRYGSSKPRKKKSPKKEAFKEWIKEYGIDPMKPLDDLVIEAEEGFKNGQIKFLVGRPTINELLKEIRKKI